MHHDMIQRHDRASEQQSCTILMHAPFTRAYHKALSRFSEYSTIHVSSEIKYNIMSLRLDLCINTPFINVLFPDTPDIQRTTSHREIFSAGLPE